MVVVPLIEDCFYNDLAEKICSTIYIILNDIFAIMAPAIRCLGSIYRIFYLQYLEYTNNATKSVPPPAVLSLLSDFSKPLSSE